jgi:hypothetical protein
VERVFHGVVVQEPQERRLGEAFLQKGRDGAVRIRIGQERRFDQKACAFPVGDASERGLRVLERREEALVVGVVFEFGDQAGPGEAVVDPSDRGGEVLAYHVEDRFGVANEDVLGNPYGALRARGQGDGSEGRHQAREVVGMAIVEALAPRRWDAVDGGADQGGNVGAHALWIVARTSEGLNGRHGSLLSGLGWHWDGNEF